MRISLKDWCTTNNRFDLLEQWDYEKNDSISPDTSTYGSTQTAHWLCDKGHSWTATINSRTRGSGCPYCSGRLPILGETDLATTHPSLALEWHPTKNGSKTPEMVKAGTHQKAWWLCPSCKFEWETDISSRGITGTGCPECAKRTISKARRTPSSGQSLYIKYPQISAEWDYIKNDPLTPHDVSYRSHQIVFWTCEKGHSWKSSISNRTRGWGCPYCGNKKVEQGFNDLATLNPELAKEWHPTKNGMLTASDVLPSSSKRIWWICSTCGHEWSSTINNRTKRGCPRCSSGIHVSFPEKAIAFYLKAAGLEIQENFRPKWLKGKELDIFIPSLHVGIEYDGEAWHKKGIDDLQKDLLCLANGIVLIHIREPNCPRISGVGPCFVLPDRKENSLNSAIEFVLETLHNEYDIILNNIEIDVTTNRTQIYELMELSTKHNSIVITHPYLTQEWHPTKNGLLKPEMFTKGSERVVWWQCTKCGHSYSKSIYARIHSKSCPVCHSK